MRVSGYITDGARTGDNGIDEDHDEHQEEDEPPGTFGFLPGQPGKRILNNGYQQKIQQESDVPEVDNREQRQDRKDPAGARIKCLHEAIALFISECDNHASTPVQRMFTITLNPQLIQQRKPVVFQLVRGGMPHPG